MLYLVVKQVFYFDNPWAICIMMTIGKTPTDYKLKERIFFIKYKSCKQPHPPPKKKEDVARPFSE